MTIKRQRIPMRFRARCFRRGNSVFEPDRAEWARNALYHLREGRDILRRIGAKRTLARVRKAIVSAEGAVRHAKAMETRDRLSTRRQP